MERIFLEIDGENIGFYILEQTTLGGISYYLVTDELREDAELEILKDLSKAEDSEAVFEFVEDEAELAAVGDIFEAMSEDIVARLKSGN